MNPINLDPSLNTYPMERLPDTYENSMEIEELHSWDQNSFSFEWTKHLKTSLMTPSQLESSLQLILQLTIARRVMMGSAHHSILYHRQQLLNEISEWLHIPTGNNQEETNPEVEEEREKHELITILSNSQKKACKFLPQNETEWMKRLNLWCRENILPNGDIKQRTMYRLLAVDGFEGVEAKNLKCYLFQVLAPQTVRKDYRLHAKAVRQMYDWIENNPSIESLTGTGSACIVFLALLELFYSHVKDIVFDDQVHYAVHHAKMNIENFLHQDSGYYKDVKNVNVEILNELGQVYNESFCEWKEVAEEYINGLINKQTDKEIQVVKSNKKVKTKSK